MSLYTTATETSCDEEKVLCEATIEDDFSDDEILIVFKQKESLSFKDYSLADFSDIGCEQIFSLSSAIIKKAKYAIESALEDISNGKTPKITKNLDLSSFRTIISLKLREPGKENVLNMIKKLEKRNDIYCVCPNYTMKFDIAPNVTPDEDSAYYTDPEDIYDLLGLTEVWNMFYSGKIPSSNSTPKVAVIDSGISHSDISKRVFPELSANLENYEEEYTSADDIPTTLLGIPTDTKGHGTHVAGIITQVVKYHEQTTLNISFSSMKVDLPTDENDSETNVRSVIAAINYVNDLNIKIINMSGNSIIGPTGFDVSATFRTAVESYQGLIICSAGNSGKYLMTEEEDNDSYHNDIYPAALICDNLITVGSSNMDDEKSSFSNWGVHNVDLFAPGEYILSCFPISKCVGNTCEIDEGYQYSHVVDGYHSLSGTSMAAPFVTGVAALLLTINPELSANELRDYILDNVDEVDALQGLCVTGGRLNALKAVTALVNNCNHTLTYSHSIEGHTSTCITCGYTKTFRNAFYVVLQTSLSITVKCSVCSTQLPACSHNLQYSPIAKEYHRAFCNVCNFGFREDHNALYEDSESNTWHDMTCTTCNYSGIEEHDWHVVEFDEDEQIYIECDQCLRTTVCEHGNYNSIDSVKHTIDCRECDILFTEDHTLLTQKVTNSLHRVYCSGCSYSQAEVHTYYEISWDETEVEVGCRKCELKISCTHQPDEEINAYTHGESCSSCGYVIAEAHTFIYTSVNNAIYHNVNCRICGYSGTEAHTWESNNGVSECPLCGQTNSSPVTPVLSLPPEDEEELTE